MSRALESGTRDGASTLLRDCVLVQPELEKEHSPLMSVFRPFGRGFQGMGVFRSDDVWGERELKVPRSIIVSMSPPGYPSAWLHPCRARFRLAWQSHCSASPLIWVAVCCAAACAAS